MRVTNYLEAVQKHRPHSEEKRMPSLKELMVALPDARVYGDDAVEVAAIAYDSRQVAPETTFVCIRGQQANGHDFIPQAIERGATAIVLDDEKLLTELPQQVTGILVPVGQAQRHSQ